MTTPSLTHPVISTVLIANRGEIACRIIATVGRMGMTSVAIYSDADADAPHVRQADHAVRVGPAAASESYLNIDAVIEAAVASGAQAVHPGYGFLAENADFAAACEKAGLVFIGPSADAMRIMGDKIRAKDHVAAAGVPLISGVGSAGMTDDQLIEAVAEMDYPLLIKPSAGGGGKGMSVVERPEHLRHALEGARRVAKAAFGNDALLIEQLISSPRHIEVQILADQHGQVVHLGERECSLQRRHQKVVEEAPSALIDEATRHKLGEAACAAARSVDYRGAGTVEFLVSAEDPERFYFMEMNTRLQVEHPVTEEITGVDLVEQQIRVAAGEPLLISQENIRRNGHSIEARIYAEDPEAGFLPSTGELLRVQWPAGPAIRVDAGVETGSTVSAEYDPMLAKIIATGEDRQHALDRLTRALSETVIHGVSTGRDFIRLLIQEPAVRSGQMDTSTIDQVLPELAFPRPGAHHMQAAALSVARAHHQWRPPQQDRGAHQSWASDGWHPVLPAHPRYTVTWDPPAAPDAAPGEPAVREVICDGTDTLLEEALGAALVTPAASYPLTVTLGTPTEHGVPAWISSADFSGVVMVKDPSVLTTDALRRLARSAAGTSPEVTAPMPGTVVAVGVVPDNTVSAGDPLLTVEAMKMEHQLTAPLDGTVEVLVAVGEHVSRGQVLARIITHESENATETEKDS